MIHPKNFYPRSPCGERRAETAKTSKVDTFLSTLSLRRATLKEFFRSLEGRKFLSTLSLRSATMQIVIIVVDTVISIHALLAESDRWNSTERPEESHFYPRSPCGERHNRIFHVRSFTSISIHALLAESDVKLVSNSNITTNFYPRSPCGERLVFVGFFMAQNLFLSTLSLRRATPNTTRCRVIRSYFYPRSPCGERPKIPPYQL